MQGETFLYCSSISQLGFQLLVAKSILTHSLHASESSLFYALRSMKRTQGDMQSV